MYDSRTAAKLYQEDPLPYKKQTFKLKGWTETIVGYMNEADKLSRCILRNAALMKRPYTWELTINVEVELKPKEITDLWTKVCRKLKKHGVVALWVREPSLSNHCNYHLIVSSDQTKIELERAVEASMPDRSSVKWHKHIKAIDDQYAYTRYMTKAKIKGYVNGKQVGDFYENKRLMFRPHLKLRKVGTVGNFWIKSKAKLWQDIRDLEQKITEGKDKPNIRRLAKYLHELVGGFIPLKYIERMYGEWADDANTQVLIEQMLAKDGY